ncbi:hypothetical protein B0H17DRAFT_1206718 [Mycena rosella]|uniref:NmrA-like domain-containing protein n=1 Tax=Mycena rosella TaxID=1033263 RepID=A0AAD7D477_MYCRO|nr:hypothetical protein B0H17DRAFT_1206718 [Mycena rosella]
MSTYKSFAVVGGGLIGLPIVNALVAQNISVVLLSRPEGSTKTEHKVDVVLSTVTTMAAAAQTSLVEAARLTGVKLFAPSVRDAD